MNQRLTVRHIESNRALLLTELGKRQGVLRDLVRGVARGYATGLYLYGRPGTAKTHTVRGVLEDDIRGPYVYQRGHITPLGLFELLDEHRQDVIVLDDMATVLYSAVGLQILLAALEPPPAGGDRGRVVEYRRRGGVQSVTFSGGLVCITNRELHEGDLLDAFRSRVHVLNYDPGDAQLGAMMLDVAGRGAGGLAPADALTVARYLIGEMLRLGCRFDLRLFFGKALPTYQQWADDATESDWRDLITASIEEHLVAVRHEDERRPAGRANRKAAEYELLRDLLQTFATREERVRAWTERTGKSERAYYRRLEEVEALEA